MPRPLLQPGDLVGEKYRVQRLIGEGGFSQVYLAHHLSMGRAVALKILRTPGGVMQGGGGGGEAESFAYRFEKEAQVLSRLKSPATVTLYDYGQTPQGHLFMVLEYIDGKTLDRSIDPRWPLPALRVARILRQALESLKEAHYHGILHRDIKPTNLMLYDHLGEPDYVKVLDFGIAKLFQQAKAPPSEHERTRTGVVVGTPRYIAPEVIEGEKALPASDLYALGLLCYELLTGHHANRGGTPLEIISFQVSPEPILLPQELLIPSSLREIIERMLAKSLATRWGSAAEVIEALRREKFGEAYDAQVFEQTMPSMKVSEELLSLPPHAFDEDAATSEFDALQPQMLKVPPPRATRVSEPLPLPPKGLGARPKSEPSKEILLEQDVTEALRAAGGHAVAQPQGPVGLAWDREEVTDVSGRGQPVPQAREERLIVLTQKKGGGAAGAPSPAGAGVGEDVEIERLRHQERRKMLTVVALLVGVALGVMVWVAFGVSR